MNFKVFYENNQSPQSWGVGDVLRHKDFGYTVRVVQCVPRGLVVEYSSHKSLLEWGLLNKSWIKI